MYVTVKVDEVKCNGCKLCVLTCPDPNVLNFIKESKKVTVNASRCKGCGLCVEACNRDAMALESPV